MREEGYVAADTLARIKASAKKLGYRPNRAARGLKMGRLQEIVLVIWSIEAMGEASELYMGKIRALDSILRKAGLPLTIRIEGEGGSVDFPEKLVEDLETDRPAGVAFFSTDLRILQKVIQRLETAEIATVVLDELGKGNFDNIMVDRGAGIKEALQHLYETGKRRIYFVGPDDAANRLQGYEEGISELGLKPYYHYLSHVGKCELLFQQGRHAARNLMNLENPPDAVITYSDPVALGMLDIFKENNLKIPEQIAIVGFDDKQAAVLCHPRLTTIAHPNVELGMAAGEVLLKKIRREKPPEGGWSRLIPAKLVIREST
jgi:LacI family transcriptional regulator